MLCTPPLTAYKKKTCLILFVHAVSDLFEWLDEEPEEEEVELPGAVCTPAKPVVGGRHKGSFSHGEHQAVEPVVGGGHTASSSHGEHQAVEPVVGGGHAASSSHGEHQACGASSGWRPHSLIQPW